MKKILRESNLRSQDSEVDKGHNKIQCSEQDKLDRVYNPSINQTVQQLQKHTKLSSEGSTANNRANVSLEPTNNIDDTVQNF